MERSVAVKKLAKMLGKGFGYQIDAKAPTPEEREEAKAALPEALAERDRLKELKRKRFEAVLAADAEYQSLSQAHTEAHKKAGNLSSAVHRHKITVGNSMNLVGGFNMFSVKASGDSWEEVIDKLTKKQAA
jgi:hypothetical protein